MRLLLGNNKRETKNIFVESDGLTDRRLAALKNKGKVERSKVSERYKNAGAGMELDGCRYRRMEKRLERWPGPRLKLYVSGYWTIERNGQMDAFFLGGLRIDSDEASFSPRSA